MENIERALSEHPFLAGISPKHIKTLSICAAEVVFKPGEFLFHEGEEADKIFFIKHGKINVETFVPQKGPITIQTQSAGEVLGWSWLVPPYRWHFDARAYELTRAVALDGACIRENCETDHDLGYEVMKRFTTVIAQRLEATRLQLLDIYGPQTNK